MHINSIVLVAGLGLVSLAEREAAGGAAQQQQFG